MIALFLSAFLSSLVIAFITRVHRRLLTAEVNHT